MAGAAAVISSSADSADLLFYFSTSLIPVRDLPMIAIWSYVLAGLTVRGLTFSYGGPCSQVCHFQRVRRYHTGAFPPSTKKEVMTDLSYSFIRTRRIHGRMTGSRTIPWSNNELDEFALPPHQVLTHTQDLSLHYGAGNMYEAWLGTGWGAGGLDIV